MSPLRLSDTALRMVAVLLMLAGAALLVASESPSLGFPLVAVGIAMTVLVHEHHGGHTRR